LLFHVSPIGHPTSTLCPYTTLFRSMEVCGDGDVDPGELCDGNCPTSCSPPNNCTNSALQGSSANCDARCVDAPVTACVDGDGCCPSNCDFDSDSDCTLDCTDLNGWPSAWAQEEMNALAQ